jgi:hypothetical protein
VERTGHRCSAGTGVPGYEEVAEDRREALGGVWAEGERERAVWFGGGGRETKRASHHAK